MSSPDKVRIGYSDDDIGRRVSGLLMSQHFPAFRRLQVDVTDGLVTLTGQVSSYYEKQVALTSCSHVAGVLSLIDQIEVFDHRSTRDSISRSVAVANR